MNPSSNKQKLPPKGMEIVPKYIFMSLLQIFQKRFRKTLYG